MRKKNGPRFKRGTDLHNRVVAYLRGGGRVGVVLNEGGFFMKLFLFFLNRVFVYRGV